MLRRLAGQFAPYGILLAEVLTFYRHVLFYGGFVIPWDLRYYHLPLAEFVARSLRYGELPLWDPHTYCGFPFYANIQAQLFYPPTLITIWLSNLAGGDRLLYFLEWQIVAHVFLGGVFCHWLIRRLGASTQGALLGATVFQLGGFFASQTQHLGAMDAAAWLPLAWLGVISLAAGFSWRWFGVLAASLAMAILAGFPAVSVVVIVSCLLLAGILLVLRRAHIKLIWTVVAAAAFSVPLTAIQVLPTVELARLSVAKYRSDWMGAASGLPLQSLWSLIVPNYYGIFDLSRYSQPWQPTFLYIYCGLVGLALAVAAAVAYRKNPQASVFAVATGLSALWMLGDSTPVGKVVLQLSPKILRSAIYPECALAAFVLGMAVLAGLGAHWFFRSRNAFLGAALIALAAFDLIAVGSGRPMNTASLAREPGLDYNHFDGNRFVLERVRVLTNRSRPPARIDTVDDSMNWAMGASLTEVPTANGNDPLALVRLMQVRLSFTGGEHWGRYYQVSNPASPVLDLLNVRYLLSRTPIDTATLEAANLTRVEQLPGREVYENTEALPRFFLVSQVSRAGGMDEALALLRAPDFDPRALAIVEDPVDFAGSEDPLPASPVKVLEYKPRKIVVEIEAPQPAFLVTSETYFPGWRVFIDGDEQPLVLTNVAFRGLPVPPGRHRVEMRFEPVILWYSQVISISAWCVLFWLVARRRARANPSSSASP